MNLMLNTSSLSRSLTQVLLTCLGHWDGSCVKFLGQLFTCLMFWVPACDSSHWSLQLPLKTDNLGRSPQTFVPNTWTTSLFALVVLTHLDTCGHLWTFVSICHVPTWWSGTPNGLTGVHATCVWVLVWDGWGRHPIRDSQVDKCEPESSRWSSGVSCWWFFNICKYFVNNNWECIFNVKYLNQSTYVFVWVWVLVSFPILFDCHCWLRALQLSVHLSNNLPAVGQIHKPTPVLNFWVLFCFVLCFDHIQI